jgi:hypothetical protein
VERILEEPGRGANIDKGDGGSAAGVRSGVPIVGKVYVAMFNCG